MNRFYLHESDYTEGETPMISQRDRNWLKSMGFALLLFLGALFVLWLTFMPKKAHAQGVCTVGGQTSCFIGSKTTGESPITTTLTWNAVGATSCTAGGAGSVAAWSGSIPCAGTRTLSGIGKPMLLTIDPVGPATAGKMAVRWTKVTQNTDGSTLTNLGGYVISYGTAAGALNQTASVPVSAVVPHTPTATEIWDSSYDLTGLTAGTWFASIQAATSACFPSTLVDCHVSQPSLVVSKAVTTTPGGALPQLSLQLDPYTVPKPPTNVVATDVIAVELTPNDDGTLMAKEVHLVPTHTSCVDAECTVLARRQ